MVRFSVQRAELWCIPEVRALEVLLYYYYYYHYYPTPHSVHTHKPKWDSLHLYHLGYTVQTRVSLFQFCCLRQISACQRCTSWIINVARLELCDYVKRRRAYRSVCKIPQLLSITEVTDIVQDTLVTVYTWSHRHRIGYTGRCIYPKSQTLCKVDRLLQLLKS